jgi:hypothetical protein
MSTILVKVFATALTLAQVTTRPEAIKTEFHVERDRTEVVQLLRDGCTHMRRAFDIEDINLDDLITTAMDDPGAVTGNAKVLQGLDFKDLVTAYRQFCKNETVASSPVDLGEVIVFYNKAVADLPDHNTLKGLKLPGHEPGARPQGRALRRGFCARQPPRAGAARRHSASCPEGFRRGGGQALLPA